MPWVLTWSESVVIALHRAAGVELPVELAQDLAVWEGFGRMLRRGLEDRLYGGHPLAAFNRSVKPITFHVVGLADFIPDGKDPK
jgi:hypothetical protein